MSSNLQLNLHWHGLLADGVWTEQDGRATFHPAEPQNTMRVQETLHDAVLRIDKVLQRKGGQDCDDDPFAELEPALAEPCKAALLGRPIGDSVALEKKAQLRGLPRPHGRNCAQMDGFSLHANTFVGPAARDERYKLVKYLCRPSIAGKRVTELQDGRFRVELKTAWRAGRGAGSSRGRPDVAGVWPAGVERRCFAMRLPGWVMAAARSEERGFKTSLRSRKPPSRE